MEAKHAPPEALVRQQAALVTFGRRASALPSLSVLMQDAVALAIEGLEADLGGVAEVRGGDTLVMQVAATDTHGKLVNSTSHESSIATNRSLAAYVVNMACPAIAADLAVEQRFCDPLLRQLGVTSALCVPLHMGGEVFGALGVYLRQPHEFVEDDVHFVETIACLLTSAIMRIRAESQVQRQQTLSSSVLNLVDALVLTLDLEGNLLDINRAGERITGYSLAQARGKRLTQFLIVPEEIDLVHGILRTCSGNLRPCEFESFLLARDGARRRVVWSIQPVGGNEGHSPSLLMIGSDRTEHLNIEAELQSVRQAAARAETALADLLRAQANPWPQNSGVGEAPLDLASAKYPARDLSLPAAGADQRSSPRREFNYYQLIAPVQGKRLPAKRDFFAVQCRDISAGGISFYLDQRPDFNILVVVLGREPGENYFTAEVVRVVTEQREGKTAFLVGCRFTGRAEI
jgi:PAS domain S-box-containing protein